MATRRSAVVCTAALIAFAAVGPLPCARAAETDEPSWNRPDAAAVRERAMQWLDAQKPSPETRKKAETIWSDPPQAAEGTDLLSRAAMTFALGDDRAAGLVEFCSGKREGRPLPSHEWFAAVDKFAAANLRLLYARRLVEHSLYDEAGELLDGLNPEDVVDPDSLLFFQAVVYHRLLKADEATACIKRLLEREDDCPRRYASLARLMQNDLEGLSDDGLDHIARRMDDVRRRLDLGRPGEKTRKIEDGIIESLDKQIKKLEEQQQQSSASASGSGGNRPSNPAGDSRLMGGRGPGRVVQRNVGAKKGWGNLPAKQRDEAMQQVGREFPAHYRDVIEQYFRKLADKEE